MRADSPAALGSYLDVIIIISTFYQSTNQSFL